jgi:hypothetical protein
MSLSDLIEFFSHPKHFVNEYINGDRSDRSATSFIDAGLEGEGGDRTPSLLAHQPKSDKAEYFPKVIECYKSSTSEPLETVCIQRSSIYNTSSTEKNTEFIKEYRYWQILHPNGLVNEVGYSPANELIAVKANYPDAIKIVPSTESVNWWEIDRDQTDEESDLMRERHQYFIAKGLKVEQAQEVAQLLLYRDRDCDDRRSCAECGMYNFGCHRGLEPVGGGGFLVLHRCHGFKDSDYLQDHKSPS